MTTDAQTPDDLDRVFGAYFKSQVPKRWPDAPVPSSHPAVNRGADDFAGRSRWTLAVSMAALLGLGLFLSAGPRPQLGANGPLPDGHGLFKDSTASGGFLKKTTTPTKP